MPRINRKKPAGDFESVFDDELEDLETPRDTIDSIPENDETTSNSFPSDKETITENLIEANRFGLSKNSKSASSELVARTFKYDKETIQRVESLVYKDQRHSKKIPGTKGFISDFMDNAIWQHLLQLGLATEEEVQKHLKSYSKYPLNFDNFEKK
ncbi:hypothetical protein [Enterococcus gallinarum]|uniref:hypothetical protein n=1 Tax=Enterococcus gallinarum TaxID=1353 RepID=UPI001AD783A2|nr:hypothetical protein [Enterococcus gallinarum]MBO6420030.1 hypothetical protein [Enterococcus gallinarum]MBO6423027.1 hypothetical protein [Enterococcus gallinarum]